MRGSWRSYRDGKGSLTMKEGKDVIMDKGKKSYKELKERLKGKKIDYAKLEADLLEMLGEPNEELLERVRRIPKHKIGE